ncbi:ralBP1-associated Eps domain-containing protein 1-like isoform X2 [Ornithodoros turicata]|uniref:ralBP1-associated Eps domain-containing protein 1-like isoform X2 n=1 Tax=Ornithodoros turicata TaxID=34597 RepID=UPI00313959A6
MDSQGLKLTEAEQRYFAELFAAYDVENQERVSGQKASELLLATQLPTEILQQITELCGAKRVGHFGRPQFYLALRLIGAAQAGMPLKPELLTSGVDVPLPKLQRPSEPGPLPPPPVSSKNKASRQASLKDLPSSPSHQPYAQQIASRGHPVAGSRDSSPEAVVAAPVGPNGDAAASPQIAAAGHDRKWTTFLSADGQLNWSQFEEHRHLLGNEEDSSEKHSSDDDHDVWCIADDQREYYTKQFQTMQSDLKGKITGVVAKEFFEKSKLPVPVLSKIWQLSDIDKDGALTLEEFCTAMHLVVLRRNNINIPDVLPAALVPSIPQPALQKSAEAVSGQGPRSNYQVKGTSSGAPPQPPLPAGTQHAVANHTIAGNASPPAPPHPLKEPLSPQNKEWTKFNDSPTSSVSSPSMKPVNFDFSSASVEQNPRILHPVARRVSPDGHAIPYSNDLDRAIASGDAAGDGHKSILKKLSAPGPIVPTGPQQSLAYVVTTEVGGDPNNSYSGTGVAATAAGAPGAPTPSQGQLAQGGPKEPPPPPPPRPKRNHARSSSLDLNRLGRSSSQNLGAPPAVPPRASPGSEEQQEEDGGVLSKSITGDDVPSFMNFADFDHFAESRSEDPLTPPRQFESGAFEPYKKPSADRISRLSSDTSYSDDDECPAPTDDAAMLICDDAESKEKEKRRSGRPPALAAVEMKTIPNEKWELTQAVRAHRERNNMLSLLNSELNQELVEATEERLALEIQLENLKPFSC